jgi:Crp-like helix-turn-helix protein
MGALERHQLARLLAPCPRLTIARGATRGASAFGGTALLIVEKGLAARVATPAGRRRMIVSFCSANAVLPPPGAAEELLGLEDCTIVLVPPPVCGRLLRFPAAALVVVESLVAQLRERDESLAQFGAVSHVERLRSKLLQLARSHGAVVDGGVRIELPLTHELLAQAIGSARETVTTASRRLEREGFVARDGRRYRLLDPACDTAHSGRFEAVGTG